MSPFEKYLFKPFANISARLISFLLKFILCTWVFCLYVTLWIMCMHGAYRGQKKALDLLGVEL